MNPVSAQVHESIAAAGAVLEAIEKLPPSPGAIYVAGEVSYCVLAARALQDQSSPGHSRLCLAIVHYIERAEAAAAHAQSHDGKWDQQTLDRLKREFESIESRCVQLGLLQSSEDVDFARVFSEQE